jgi:clan AA aspartic protease (TIGR02281 family)
MATHILIRETKPNRDPPRLAWVVALAALIGLIGVVFSADGYRHKITLGLHEFAAWFDPGNGNVIRITADARGHYRLTGSVNGENLQFMVDSGATNVVLNRAAASQLSLGRLNFDTVSSTANGTVLNAKIKLRTLEIQSFVVTDFPAFVGGGELDECLLGATWIHLFKSVEIKNGVMTLRY